MASYISLLVHFVWSTKDREPLIRPQWSDRLRGYLGGILEKKHGILLTAGTMPDHLHLLTSLPSTVSVAEIVNALKSNSSKWIHEEIEQSKAFGWQEKYGAFSVSKSMEEQVKEYINNQERHHRGRSFKDEFRALLKRHEIEYDERHIWD